MPLCSREFLSNCRQSVELYDATTTTPSEWISIISGMPQQSALGPFVFNLYMVSAKMFKLVEIILFAYADDSTLQAVFCKPVESPTVDVSCCRISQFAKVMFYESPGLYWK